MDPITLSAVLLTLAGLILLMLGILGLVGTLPRAAFIVLGIIALFVGLVLLAVIYVVPAAASSASEVGIVLIIIGVVLLLYSVAKSEGRAVLALIAVLLIAGGVLLGGLTFVTLQPVLPPATPGAIWDVSLTGADTIPTSVVVTSTFSKQDFDIYGSKAEFVKITEVALGIQIVNLNAAGASTQFWQFSATTTRIDSVINPSMGTSTPIASKATFTGTGFMSGDTYYDTVATNGIKDIQAHIPIDGPAFANAQIGGVYSVLLRVAGATITVNFHPTSG